MGSCGVVKHLFSRTLASGPRKSNVSCVRDPLHVVHPAQKNAPKSSQEARSRPEDCVGSHGLRLSPARFAMPDHAFNICPCITQQYWTVSGLGREEGCCGKYAGQSLPLPCLLCRPRPRSRPRSPAASKKTSPHRHRDAAPPQPGRP